MSPGERPVVGVDLETVPIPGGSETVEDARLELYDLHSGTPTFVQEISPLDAIGGPAAGQLQVAPYGLDVVGTHIAFSAHAVMQAASGQSSAVSIDGHPAP